MAWDVLSRDVLSYILIFLNHLITMLVSEAFLVFKVNRLGSTTFTLYTTNILCMCSKANTHNKYEKPNIYLTVNKLSRKSTSGHTQCRAMHTVHENERRKMNNKTPTILRFRIVWLGYSLFAKQSLKMSECDKNGSY